jgi:hypothetical protein
LEAVSVRTQWKEFVAGWLWVVRTFALLQKKCFGKRLTRLLTQFYFPLTWPLNYVVRKYIKSGDYWSRVDEVLFLGAVPLQGWLFQHAE